MVDQVLMIEKVNSETGMFENEVIQYAAGGILEQKYLSGLIRGTNAPYRGETPANTTASNSSDAELKFLVQERFIL